MITGDLQAKVMTETQPMKMAAAEALYETSAPASFSAFTIGSLDGSKEVWSLRVPHGLSFLATGSWGGEVEGINDLQAAYEQRFGPGSYTPNVPLTYWTFRFMILCGFLAAAIALLALWLLRRERLSASKWLVRAALAVPFLPLLGNSFGWIFTEMGRQPWIVFGLMQTRDGVSPSVGAGTVLTSMIVLTLLYGLLAVVEVFLLLRFAREVPPETESADPEAAQPAFLY
jgi:cytochrome d ubiquinol oxidase subunit I